MDHVSHSSLRSGPQRVLEVIGPAGAGKTTLLLALEQRNPAVEAGIAISKWRQFPYVVSNSATLLRPFLLEYRRTKWFTRREARSMAYLRAWLDVLERRVTSGEGGVIVLDHGPLYRLAMLREFGPSVTQSESFRRWWATLFAQWATTLDALIWLDAPNQVLLARIRSRDDRHSIKEEDDREAHDFLDRHRAALERIVAQGVDQHRLTALRFDTGTEDVDEIAVDVLRTLEDAAK